MKFLFILHPAVLTLACLVGLAGCTPQSPPVTTASEADAGSPIPRMADGKPNLNGIWQAMNEANWNLEPHGAEQGPVYALGAQFSEPPGLGVVVGGTIPTLPEAAGQVAENYDDRLARDPEIKCFMAGVPRSTYLPYPFQIIQSDRDILLAYQFAGAVRQVNMGAPLEAVIPSWMGWNNGRWEGDTLVIDVTGLNANWLDRAGHYYSGNARVTERYSLVTPDLLHYEATITDDTVFSEPWTIAMPLYRRQEPDMQLLEYKCPEFAEEAMYGDLRKEPLPDTLH